MNAQKCSTIVIQYFKEGTFSRKTIQDSKKSVIKISTAGFRYGQLPVGTGN
jgi:hypothetical protein